MASTREQLQLLQKAQKRARVQTADDDSILEEETVDEHAEEDTTASHDQENKQPVQFQRGTTNQGNICLWYREFRYVRTRKNGIWFRCEQRSCKASLLLQDVENLTGILGPNEHNHIAAPSRQQAETSRHGMKQQIHANPRARPFRLRAQGRADVDDEVFERMGTDEALDRMIARVKNKTFRNVNRANPLEIQIPPELLMKDGESTLVYDSRITRPNQADVVLVFSHGKLLDLLKKNRRWSLDGTFSSAARPWTQVLIIGCYAGNRLIVAVQALIPGKKSSYYREVLDVVRRLVNPVQPAKCNYFHYFDNYFQTVRSVLSLALIPPEHVRRAFMLIVGYSVPGLQGWLGYFARNYIGLSQLEKDRGAAAFDLLRVFLRRSRRRSRNAIERPNNGMEAAHKYFAKDLNHHPSLSDYLAALLSDVDKQVDTARAVRLQHSHAANFDTDEGLIDAVHLLGLVIQGFVDGLRVPNEDEEENETSEEE
ncbi:hypothetical protein DdX_08715 [Ditylenchus destructor]|uniref:FLYWCH-type domain-containing protein n=1 Tax=Ditylenchus destructor TaxID=166010 RepID=A0AAD4N0Q1_9BILA|nr:hypothetical protein DdX_08715 [Ditylenchus destructor]